MEKRMVLLETACLSDIVPAESELARLQMDARNRLLLKVKPQISMLFVGDSAIQRLIHGLQGLGPKFPALPFGV